MKKTITLLLAVFTSSFVSAQATWADDAAEVFFNKCTDCHHNGGIAPFSLMTYNDAYTNRLGIIAEVAGNSMPPWTADTSYQSYSHERFLSASEKSKIMDWFNDGALQGNPSNAPAPPVYTTGRLIPVEADLSLKMPTYASNATSTQDDYSCFVIPTGLVTNKKIKAIEVVPGNPQTVHHCLVYKVPAGTYSTDTSGTCGGPSGSSDQLMAGYTPGASPTVFPSGGGFKSGISLNTNEELLFAMHYPAGSAGLVDSTKVNIYFYPDTVSGLREIYAAPVLQDWSFCIDSGAIDTVSDIYPPSGGLTQDFSLLSVFPHMHLIGQSIESYGVTALNDTIPFIKIPIWDFDWQDFYFFEKILKAPTGTRLYGQAIYNNKPGANPHFPNPNPVQVCAGTNTSDEMFLIYFHFMAYQAGDENINIDSLNKIWLDSVFSLASIDEIGDGIKLTIDAYPNPAIDEITFSYKLQKNSVVSAIVYDSKGSQITNLFKGEQQEGINTLKWNGKKGVYYLSMLINGVPIHKKFIISP